MPRKGAKAAASWNDAPQENAVNFFAVAAAMALLAGCAVNVPLREIAPSGHIMTEGLELNSLRNGTGNFRTRIRGNFSRNREFLNF